MVCSKTRWCETTKPDVVTCQSLMVWLANGRKAQWFSLRIKYRKLFIYFYTTIWPNYLKYNCIRQYKIQAKMNWGKSLMLRFDHSWKWQSCIFKRNRYFYTECFFGNCLVSLNFSLNLTMIYQNAWWHLLIRRAKVRRHV